MTESQRLAKRARDARYRARRKLRLVVDPNRARRALGQFIAEQFWKALGEA